MSTATTRSTRREPVTGHVRPQDFRHRAACRSVSPEVFFPAAVQGRDYEQQVSVAKAVCAGCPVRAECLAWAVAHQPDGIAGGMTEHERRQEMARRRSARRGARLPKPRVPGRPVGGSRAEITAAGKAAIAAGLTAREAAGEFLVSPTTAARWARAVHASNSTDTSSSDMAEGSAGGNRAPLLISHNNALAGTRAAEGHRS